MQLYVGIDDTDNLESRGTGYRVRCLGALLERSELGRVRGITRHQLFVSPEIPYTSHNSSACLALETDHSLLPRIAETCREFLLSECAPGSDAGLCITPAAAVPEQIRDFGRRAKHTVLTQSEARELAAAHGLMLEGLTGDRGGVIGALAAAGLRAEGRDGRFIWCRGVREHAGKAMRLGELRAKTEIDLVQTLEGAPLTATDEVIDLGVWARPVLMGGQAVLLVEENHGDESAQWRVVHKDIIKRY